MTQGRVFGGIVGTDIVRFDLYGTDYVIANKMESRGAPGKINVSSRTKDLLEDLELINYTFEENKKIYIKSAGGDIQSYFIKMTSKMENWGISKTPQKGTRISSLV